MNYSNLILIGMPGAGKSSVGVLLAKRTMRHFTDTDVLIQASCNRSLQDIVDRDGYLALRQMEEKTLLGLSLHNSVIATGGSAVYSHAGMCHLRFDGLVVFLDVTMATLESRVHDFSSRGLAKRQDQSLEELYQERLALYLTYADLVIPCDNLTHEQVCDRIILGIEERG